jgi:hypothetical protein
MLNEFQVKEIENYLKENHIENRFIFSDFLDHLCCMVEEKISEGFSFEESMQLSVNQLSGKDIKNIELFTLKLLNMETSFSSRISLLATIPFGLFGLSWALSNSGWAIPHFIETFFLIASILSMFALLGVGWVKEFPRWSFPAVGFCLLVSLYFMMVCIPNISDELLGFWAWTPLLVTVIICLMFKPKLEPLKKFFQKIKEEPGLILFALYGFAPFFLFLLCDEIQSVSVLPVILLSTVILAAGIYFFLKSEKKKIRLFSILLSGALATVLTFGFCYWFWEGVAV